MSLKISLFLILLLSLFVRTYNLKTLPPSLFYDEVDAGYQAMTFNHNQTDYYGNKFPVHFHSFSDWRTSLDIYTIAAFQKITGDNELSVRLPSVLFGVISVALIYLITGSRTAAFLMAISPWSIHFSRAGFEVSGMIATILAGILFWQKYLASHHHRFLYLSIFFFLLSPYFYSTAKMFIVIIALLIVIIWRQEIIRLGFKRLLLLFIFSTLVLAPLAVDTIKGRSGFRFSYISIFSQPDKAQVTNRMRYEDVFTEHSNEIGVKTPLTSFYFHNKHQVVLEKFINNYFSSFSTNFFVLTGDTNLRQGFGNFGMAYFLDLFFMAIGVFYSLKNKKNIKLSKFFLWVFILAPIPFALTRDSNSPHATRLILMLPSIIYFTSLGVIQLASKYKVIFYLSICLYSLLFLNFWHHYHLHYPQISAIYWNTGVKESVLATKKYPNRPVFYSNKYAAPLSFYLFYQPYLLPASDSITNHLQEVRLPYFSGQKLDRDTYFGYFDWSDKMILPKNSIVVIPKSEFPSVPQSRFSVLETISKKYIEQEEFLILQYL